MLYADTIVSCNTALHNRRYSIVKRFLEKYHLELFTAIVLVFSIADLVLFSEISQQRKLVNLFMILGVLHEWEEKRYPGGFYELMAKKFNIKTDKEGLDKAGLCVIGYWLAITCAPYLFDRAAFLLMLPVALGIFEAFVHTMGIFIHKMKKPYTPGLVSAWVMAAAAVYTICCLESLGTVGAGTCILGTLLMFGGFLLMDIGVLHSIGMTPKDVFANVKALRSKK